MNDALAGAESESDMLSINVLDIYGFEVGERKKITGKEGKGKCVNRSGSRREGEKRRGK